MQQQSKSKSQKSQKTKLKQKTKKQNETRKSKSKPQSKPPKKTLKPKNPQPKTKTKNILCINTQRGCHTLKPLYIIEACQIPHFAHKVCLSTAPAEITNTPR